MSSRISNNPIGSRNRRSIRLPVYDYSRPGYYFVTICIHEKNQNLFGEIANGEMVCNEFGIFATRCWHDIPVHFPLVKLDVFIVMPDHVHGIIQLCEPNRVSHVGGHVGVQNFEPLPKSNKPSNPMKNQFQHIIPRSIGSIIRGYKTGVSKMVRRRIPDIPVWQRNYFEHIIRDEKSLDFIRNYIRENPHNWNSDRETHFM